MKEVMDPMAQRKRYALIGTGGRAEFFWGALVKDFRETSELVAFCDINSIRMDYSNKLLQEKYNHPPVPPIQPIVSTI